MLRFDIDCISEMGYHIITILSMSILCSYPTLAIQLVGKATMTGPHNWWIPCVIHCSFNPLRDEDHEDPNWPMFFSSWLKPPISFTLLVIYPMISDTSSYRWFPHEFPIFLIALSLRIKPWLQQVGGGLASESRSSLWAVGNFWVRWTWWNAYWHQ